MAFAVVIPFRFSRGSRSFSFRTTGRRVRPTLPMSRAIEYLLSKRYGPYDFFSAFAAPPYEAKVAEIVSRVKASEAQNISARSCSIAYLMAQRAAQPRTGVGRMRPTGIVTLAKSAGSAQSTRDFVITANAKNQATLGTGRAGHMKSDGSALCGKSNGPKIGLRATPIWGMPA